MRPTPSVHPVFSEYTGAPGAVQEYTTTVTALPEAPTTVSASASLAAAPSQGLVTLSQLGVDRGLIQDITPTHKSGSPVFETEYDRLQEAKTMEFMTNLMSPGLGHGEKIVYAPFDKFARADMMSAHLDASGLPVGARLVEIKSKNVPLGKYPTLQIDVSKVEIIVDICDRYGVAAALYWKHTDGVAVADLHNGAARNWQLLRASAKKLTQRRGRYDIGEPTQCFFMPLELMARYYFGA